MIGCTYTQFDQIQAIKKYFGENVVIATMTENPNLYLIKMNNDQIWMVRIESNNAFKGLDEPSNTMSKYLIVFSNETLR